MKKRILSLVLCMLLAIGVFAGCGSKEQTSTTDLTVMYKLVEGGSDTTIMDKLAEGAGVNVSYIKAPSASYTEKLNSVLASGNLPDVVYLDETNMNGWIEEGALLPLDDLIEKYADNFKNAITEEDMKNLVNPYDGKLYGTSYILRLPVDKTMGVRRDWMKKLNLEDPTTIEELEEVLTKFKENADILNPGGSVIPMVGGLEAFYMLFGIQLSGENNVWTLDENGNYISIYEHPNYIKCIETLNRFYKKGLFDPEYLSRTNADDIYALYNNGVAGMGWVYSTRLREITEILQEKNPDAVFDYMAPVKGISGKQQIPGRRMYGTRACITIAAEGKEEDCIRYIDYLYSEAGDRLLNYGLEGTHYDMVDGKPVIKDEFNHGWVELRKAGIVQTNLAYNRNLDAYNQCMFYGKDISELNEYELLTYKAYYENEPFVVSPIPVFKSETDATDVYSLLKEKSAKAIAGDISLEELKEAVADAKGRGLDQITAEMQKLWNNVK